MSEIETLSIDILSIAENGTNLENVTCVLLLGSRILNSNIPTERSINFEIEKLRDVDTLTVLFKQNNEYIAKSFITLGDIRTSISQNYHLEPLGIKAETEANLTWEHSFSLIRESSNQAEAEPSAKQENPFQQSLETTDKNLKGQLHQKNKESIKIDSENGENSQRKGPNTNDIVTFEVLPSKQSLSNIRSPKDQLFNQSNAENLLKTLESKIKEGGNFGASQQSDINEILDSLKASVHDLGTNKSNNLYYTIPELRAEYHVPSNANDNARFFQTTPGYSIIDQSSKGYGSIIDSQRPQAGEQNLLSETYGDRLQSNYLKIPEGKERTFSEIKEGAMERQISDYQGFLSNFERTASKALSERSVIEDVRIEKNEDYLLSMKNQLTSKNITFINDQLTRDIILHMSRSKKKVTAVRLRRSITIREKEEIEIDKKSFFNPNCNAMYVHFFQPSTKHLYLFDLIQPFDSVEEKATKVELDIDFEISPYHKSLITPGGLIFIASGQAAYSNTNEVVGSNTLHVYSYKHQTLVEKAPMRCEQRQQFGFCYMSKNLFAMGGIVDGKISASCERFDLRSNKWFRLAPMARALKDVSICSFNSRFVYRFFGINSGNNIDHSVERYDAVRDSWTTLNVAISDNIKEINLPFCTQVSPDSIFIFGGKNMYGFAPKMCKGWILKVEDKRGSNNAELVESKNFLPGLAGNFNGNSVLTHAGDIIFLRESY